MKTLILKIREARITAKAQHMALGAVAALAVGLGILLVYVLTRGCGSAEREAVRETRRVRKNAPVTGVAVCFAARMTETLQATRRTLTRTGQDTGPAVYRSERMKQPPWLPDTPRGSRACAATG